MAECLENKSTWSDTRDLLRDMLEEFLHARGME
jgi:hypothetical protein